MNSALNNKSNLAWTRIDRKTINISIPLPTNVSITELAVVFDINDYDYSEIMNFPMGIVHTSFIWGYNDCALIFNVDSNFTSYTFTREAVIAGVKSVNWTTYMSLYYR